MFAKEGCRYDVLLARIRKIAIGTNIPLQLRYRGQVIRLTMVLVYDEKSVGTGYDLLYGNVHSFCENEEVVDERILQFCPAIMLLKEDINTLRVNNVSLFYDGIPGHQNSSGSALQRVCVDSYFSAIKSNTAATMTFCFYMNNILQYLTLIFVISQVHFF